MGDHQKAIARALRGLEIARAHPMQPGEPGYEHRLAPWTHTASRYMSAGELDQAGRVIKEGLETFGHDSPDCGYLWGLWARLYDERAKRCRETAEKLLPSKHCAI